ncbi:MAG: hypothetical protein LBL81_00305 [Tannerella sp.]|nr:hypothetical protein [Tannerella sp.]
MTEEEKAARRMAKEQAFEQVSKYLKHLSYQELDEVITLSTRYKKEQLGKEELRLIKEKEQIEQQLEKLKQLDAKEDY